MFLFQFTDEALHLVSDYVQKVRRNMGDLASDGSLDRNAIDMFLSDIKDDIKFLAIRLSMKRKANVVDAQDMKSALRQLMVELFRGQKIFSLRHKEVLDEMNVLGRELNSVEKPQVLDVGCGWGRAARNLKKHLKNKGEVVGVDLDVLALKYGKSLDGEALFLRSHMSHLPFKDNVFDVVLSNKALHEIENYTDQNRTLLEIVRVLKPQGLTYVCEPFARSKVARLIQKLFRKFSPKLEAHGRTEEFEDNLSRIHLRVVRKSCVVWPAFSLRTFCSYIAENA